MDCREAEELLESYLLGALDSRERELVDSHLETCLDCNLKLQGDGETVARFALAVPQLEVPPRVKERLFSRIEAASPTPKMAPKLAGAFTGFWESLGGAFVSHTGKAVAGVLVLGLVFGGVWFNFRLDQISEENKEQSALLEATAEENREQSALLEATAKENKEQSALLEAAAEEEAHVVEMVRDQHRYTYEALLLSVTPGTSLNMLWGTPEGAGARGMVMVSHTGAKALLLVLDLPPLSRDQVYQIWLIKDDSRYSGGLFTVDSTGFGQTVIIPVSPFAEFDAIGITVEPAGGSVGPTGTSVLKGDL